MRSHVYPMLVIPTILLCTLHAAAQSSVAAPAQETLIDAYVTKHRVNSVEDLSVSIETGAHLPDTVKLQTMEAFNVSYGYAVLNGKTVLVDPETRRIIRVINEAGNQQ